VNATSAVRSTLSAGLDIHFTKWMQYLYDRCINNYRPWQLSTSEVNSHHWGRLAGRRWCQIVATGHTRGTHLHAVVSSWSQPNRHRWNPQHITFLLPLLLLTGISGQTWVRGHIRSVVTHTQVAERRVEWAMASALNANNDLCVSPGKHCRNVVDHRGKNPRKTSVCFIAISSLLLNAPTVQVHSPLWWMLNLMNLLSNSAWILPRGPLIIAESTRSSEKCVCSEG